MQRKTWKAAGWAAVIGGLAALMQGCESMYYSEAEDTQVQQQNLVQQAARQDADRASREVATLRADLHAFQESQKQLYTAIDELRQENSARAQEIEKLRSLVAALDARMNSSDGAWRNDMSSFKDKLAQDQQKAMNKLTINLADEMAKNLNQVKQSAESSRAAAQAAGAKEYTVQAGDTVSAIAKAFGITPAALTSANGIKGSTIRVGQKLKIPAN
jgi:predicted RNase H-like nuclease (RuvC/YqgF family)